MGGGRVQVVGRTTNNALVKDNHFHDAYDGVGQYRSSSSRITGNLFERAHGLGVGTARSWLEGCAAAVVARAPIANERGRSCPQVCGWWAWRGGDQVHKPNESRLTCHV